MHIEDVSSTERRERVEKKSLTTKIRTKQIELDVRNNVNNDVRHRELRVCEVEKCEITPLSHVTYEVEDEGKKVDIEFEDVIRVKLDEDGNWNSILERTKSE